MNQTAIDIVAKIYRYLGVMNVPIESGHRDELEKIVASELEKKTEIKIVREQLARATEQIKNLNIAAAEQAQRKKN